MMTIREIAKQAGVSLQTVSNVLNDRTSQMGAETRERVLEAIAKSGYQPNASARGLRSQRSYTIAFLTVDPAARFLADPFHTLIVSGMADALRERDYCLLVQALNPEGPAEAFTRLFRQRRFDGAVLHLSGLEADRKRCVKELLSCGCPFVLIEEKVTGPKAACVLADNRQGAAQAAEYLRSRGHMRIAFLTPERSWPAVEERLAGYREAWKTYQLPVPREWRVPSESIEAARTVAEAALRRETSVSTVCCSNDVLAVGALQAARNVDRKVPDDIAIVGFDDFDFAQYVAPPLTTVCLPGYEMGHRAALMLLEFMQGGTFAEPVVIFPTTLVVRGTA